jgi:hypothetical protein
MQKEDKMSRKEKAEFDAQLEKMGLKVFSAPNPHREAERKALAAAKKSDISTREAYLRITGKLPEHMRI